MPVARENEIVRPDQPEASVRERLVDYDLRSRRVEQAAVEDQRRVHVVQAHRTVLATADAPKHELITCLLGLVHVAESLGGFTHNPDQGARLSAAVQRGVGLRVYRLRVCGWEAQNRETTSAGNRYEPSELHKPSWNPIQASFRWVLRS
jgi:hypothetical protein